jgi:ABC-type sugar transport system ATPase subunit
VESVELTGSEQSVIALVGDQKILLIVRDRRPIVMGDELMVTFPPEAIHLFDDTTGMRLHGRR